MYKEKSVRDAWENYITFAAVWTVRGLGVRGLHLERESHSPPFLFSTRIRHIQASGFRDGGANGHDQ